jgi:peptidoglycan/xylan/chitin deacetylase (PgdA/CDA1 family)
VDPTLFAEQMAALRECKLNPIRFGEVPAALSNGRSGVAITIDDGLADAAENARPILAQLGMTATLFVPSGYVGGHSQWLRGADAGRPMLSWKAIESLAQDGFEIGSHGRMHLAADVNEPEVVELDARASRLELEDHIGRPVTSFAYPFGYHSPAAQRAVRTAGFRQACAVGDLPARAGDNRWALPRLQVGNHTTPEALMAMVEWRPRPPAQAWPRSKQGIWRLGRRSAGWGPSEAGRGEGAPRRAPRDRSASR